MKIIIGSDNIQEAAELKDILRNLNYEVIGVGRTKNKIISLIENLNPDLVLLNVMLDKKPVGIDVGHYITNQAHIPYIYLISPFTLEMANMVIEINPNGYILKPFQSIAVLMAIKMAAKNFKTIKKENYIIIKRGLFRSKLDLNKILFIKSDDNYIEIYTQFKTYIQRICLNQLFKEITTKGFIRIHRCYVINKHHIKKLKPNEAEIGKFKIPISRTYLKVLKKSVISYGIENMALIFGLNILFI